VRVRCPHSRITLSNTTPRLSASVPRARAAPIGDKEAWTRPSRIRRRSRGTPAEPPSVSAARRRASSPPRADFAAPGAFRIALVTGGNKGIGLETCRQLATRGLKVVLTARNEARGLEAVEAIRRSSGAAAAAEVFFHQLDVTDPSSAARLADFVRGQFGRLDILINNAGISGVDRDPILFAKVKDQVLLSLN